MARKKKTEQDNVTPTADRHLQPKITLRLPAAASEALRQMAATEDRTMTAIVLRALKQYAAENGYAWPGKAQEPPA